MKYFAPSRANGLALRKDMETALWASVRSELGEQGGFASLRIDEGDLPASPADFADYFDLAFCAPGHEDQADTYRADAKRRLEDKLKETQFGKSGDDLTTPRITTLDGSQYNAERHAQLIRWMDIEPINPMGLARGANDEMEIARGHIDRVFELLRLCVPDLYEETVVVLDEIVSVKADGSQRFDYDGGSTFAMWGLVLINADAHPGWPRYCKTIVHEAAHNVLFALARREALVLNDPDEFYFSPLRDDRRPMDGIFHAAFVAARESLVFDRILARDDANGELSHEERSAVEELFETSVITFWQCDEAMSTHVSLSDLGKAILADCKVYMEKNFALVVEGQKSVTAS